MSTVTGGGKSFRAVLIWGLLLVLLAAIAIFEFKDKRAASNEATADHAILSERALLLVPYEGLGAVEVVHQGAIHRFERDAKGAWLYHVHGPNVPANHAHQGDPALAPAIDKALVGFSRTRMERQLVRSDDKDEFGVTVPQLIVMVYRTGQTEPLSKFAIGSLAPDNLSRYVLVDNSRYVVTIANYQVDNLLGLVARVGGNKLGGGSLATPTAEQR
jgi:hypothetical protein